MSGKTDVCLCVNYGYVVLETNGIPYYKHAFLILTQLLNKPLFAVRSGSKSLTGSVISSSTPLSLRPAHSTGNLVDISGNGHDCDGFYSLGKTSNFTMGE